MSQRIGHILAEDHALASLVREARRLERATAALRAHLDPVFASHCAVGQLSEQTVVVVVDSPVWASRMRYLVPQLEALFARHLSVGRAPAVRTRVAPAHAPTPQRDQRAVALSKGARQALLGAAASLEAGPLRDVLRRMAARDVAHENSSAGEDPGGSVD